MARRFRSHNLPPHGNLPTHRRLIHPSTISTLDSASTDSKGATGAFSCLCHQRRGTITSDDFSFTNDGPPTDVNSNPVGGSRLAKIYGLDASAGAIPS